MSALPYPYSTSIQAFKQASTQTATHSLPLTWHYSSPSVLGVLSTYARKRPSAKVIGIVVLRFFLSHPHVGQSLRDITPCSLFPSIPFPPLPSVPSSSPHLQKQHLAALNCTFEEVSTLLLPAQQDHSGIPHLGYLPGKRLGIRRLRQHPILTQYTDSSIFVSKVHLFPCLLQSGLSFFAPPTLFHLGSRS